MTGYFRKRRLNKAFRAYVHLLGPELAKQYGVLDQYTVKQILASANALSIDKRFIVYAVALFRRDESENTNRLLGVNQNFLNSLRQEIANSIFSGNIRFGPKDVFTLGKRIAWRGGPPPRWMANAHGYTSL